MNEADFKEILQDTRNRLLADNQTIENKVSTTINYLDDIIGQLK